MALRITVFYNQFQQGWTETYYNTSITSPAEFLNANPPSSWYPFVAFRHTSVSLYGIRAAKVGSPGSGQSWVFNGENTLTGGRTSEGNTADVTSTSAYINLYDFGNHKRPLYLRGLTDSDVLRQTNGQSIPSPALSRGIISMVNRMGNKGFQLQNSLRMATPTAVPETYVQTVAPSVTNLRNAVLTVYGALPSNIAVGSRLSFKGIPRDDLPGFPKLAKVTAFSRTPSDGQQVQISYRVRMSGPAPYTPASLSFVVEDYVYFPIASWAFLRFGERKTGRPIGVPRGRIRPAVRAQ